MPLENMRAMLSRASAGRYAVGAFNILDYSSAKAVVQAAEELDAPVIIQTSAKTVTFWGSRTLAGWIRELAGGSKAPVALHLDHCKDLDLIRECIDAGWTSVMIDASARPFEENVALSRRVVEMARPKDVTVEAELGAIVGVEDDIHVKEQDSHGCMTVVAGVIWPIKGGEGTLLGETGSGIPVAERSRRIGHGDGWLGSQGSGVPGVGGGGFRADVWVGRTERSGDVRRA